MLDALQAEDIVRKDLCLDLGFIDPEVGITVQFAKSDLILAFVTGVISRRASTDTALGELADDRAAVVDLRDRDLRGPEHRDPIECDQGQQADDHAEADDEAEAGEPDPRFTAGGTAIGVGSDHDLDDFIALTQALAENFREGVNHEGEQKETASPEEERAKVAANPNYEIPEGLSNCEPDGMPTMMTMPYSLEFLITPGKIVINQEALMMVRRIYTDGRSLPAADEIDPNFYGYSVGHWEGDTLVVETIGTRAGQRLGEAGITNSENLKITEHIYLDAENKDLLHLDFTFEDSNVLEQPWHRTHTFRRDRTWDILEYVCAENDRHPLDEEGQTQADF